MEDWRHFPEFEKLFDGGRLPRFLEAAEKTCRRLDEIAQQGAGRERDRAKAALGAYGRTLELVNQLAEMQKSAGR